MKCAIVGVLIFLGMRGSVVDAAELVLQAGSLLQEGPAARAAVAWSVAPWVDVQAGVLEVRGGAIVDLTPVARTRGRTFLHGGVGLGYNAVAAGAAAVAQSQGLVFRTIAGVGFKATSSATLTLDAVHYSNGGRYNPIFGTTHNGGYSGVLLGAEWRF